METSNFMYYTYECRLQHKFESFKSAVNEKKSRYLNFDFVQDQIEKVCCNLC